MPEEMSTKEIIKNYEKLAEEIKKDAIPPTPIISPRVKGKVIRTAAKVLAGGMVGFGIAVPLTSCKEAPTVVEEQVEGEQEEIKNDEVVISSETKEETKETPPVVEETPEKIEWEGMTITPIEGLRFDKGTFFAEAGNPYNLEVGEKAGVFVKDAVEINGKMESSIGLRPEVIEAMQKKIMEEEREFKYAFPIDLEQAKGIKIKEVEDKRTDDWTKNDGVFWDNNFNMVISNIPLRTIIYSPVSTSSDGYSFFRNDPTRNDYYHLSFLTNSSLKEKLFRGNERIDSVAVGIDVIGIKPLPEGIEGKMVQDEGSPFAFYRSDVKIGTPVAEIISKEYLNDQYWDKSISPSEPASEPSIFINYQIAQFDDLDQMSKYLIMGLEGLLKLGEEEMFVFISPAHE